MTDTMNAKTSWTCPDCCVNPCECTFMGDAAIRKDAGQTGTLIAPPMSHNKADQMQRCNQTSITPSTLNAVTEEKLVEDIAADICDTVSRLNGLAYTPAQWMGTARNALKHFKYHSQREIPATEGDLREAIDGVTDNDYPDSYELATAIIKALSPFLRRQCSKISVINYDALKFACAVAKGDNVDVREIIEAYLGALPKREISGDANG